MFPSVRTAKSGDIPLSLADSRVFNVSNAIVHTRPNITAILLGTTKQTLISTLYVLRLNSVNLALIPSSAWTVNVITKPAQTYALYENVISIKSNI